MLEPINCGEATSYFQSPAVLRESVSAPGGGNVAGAGAHHRQRSHRRGAGAGFVELRLDQIARPEIRRVGIGDVFGEHALALLVPLHLGAERRQNRKIVDSHRIGTLPLLLNDFESNFKKGDNLIFAAFGGGFTWGSIYLKWAYDKKEYSK